MSKIGFTYFSLFVTFFEQQQKLFFLYLTSKHSLSPCLDDKLHVLFWNKQCQLFLENICDLKTRTGPTCEESWRAAAWIIVPYFDYIDEGRGNLKLFHKHPWQTNYKLDHDHPDGDKWWPRSESVTRSVQANVWPHHHHDAW